MTQGILHGPYDQWTRKIGGKTVNLNLDPESAKLVKAWIRNNRMLRKLCRRLEKTSLAALQTSTTMEKIRPQYPIGDRAEKIRNHPGTCGMFGLGL